VCQTTGVFFCKHLRKISSIILQGGNIALLQGGNTVDAQLLDILPISNHIYTCKYIHKFQTPA